ncbi:ketopantoate reductase family protein [Neobacillus drentensis]|uniref:ketopantoate reductase family protein n=1 Tax=Neobacillus drentensis TaxID=220684 RepID=UPI003001B186
MEIKKVSIIGLGALGIMYGHYFSKRMPKADLRIIADRKRIERYEKEHVYCNGERCEFTFLTPDEICDPADLLIFTVKYDGLKDAIQSVLHHVGEHTIILSALNGISSEAVIGETYGDDHILYCVAQGMDAVKVGNQLTYDHRGILVIGEREPDLISDKVKSVAAFFEKVGLPYEIDTNMVKRQWGKFMLNVGVNQTVAIFQSNYGEVQGEGKSREMMIAAMNEVIALSEKAGINLTEADLDYWLSVLATLSPDGKPSMAQDVEASRPSEVELFAGTVLNLADQYRIPTPVNKELYKRIQLIEGQYK